MAGKPRDIDIDAPSAHDVPTGVLVNGLTLHHRRTLAFERSAATERRMRLEAARELHARGMTARQIADLIGAERKTVHGWLNTGGG